MKHYERMIEIRKQMSELASELVALKKNCPHERTTAKLVETLAFDNTPRKVCQDCGELLGQLSDSEIKSLYKEELEDIWERELSDKELNEFFIKNPKGYNY